MPADTAIVTERQAGPGQGGRGGSFGDGRFGEGGRFRGGPQEIALRTYMTGMWLGLGAITMLFAAFTSAYIVRRGASNDWQPVEIPSLLWFNTAVLVASSLTLERARRAMRGDAFVVFRRWWSVTTLLGVAFLLGQIVVWRQLAAQGIYLATHPGSSFFYLLTGAHGLHLLGGVAALLYVVVGQALLSALSRTSVEVTALYWHFMDGLWVYLLLVLLFWR